MTALIARVRSRVRRVPPLRRAYAKIDAVVRYWPQVRTKPAEALRFVFADPECDNYTYEIANASEMATFLASALGVSRAAVTAAVEEIETDGELREALNRRLRTRSDRRPTALYARRAGWYALVRVTRPRHVVEVGVHDGLGSSLLLRALERNGGDGRLTGIDIDSSAGWLVPPWLRPRYDLIIEDSATALPRVAQQQPVDLLVVDGDHGYGRESADYAAATPGLSHDAIVISDNSRFSPALEDFAARQGMRFAFWAESPVRHFFVGEGIGLALARGSRDRPIRPALRSSR